MASHLLLSKIDLILPLTLSFFTNPKAAVTSLKYLLSHAIVLKRRATVRSFRCLELGIGSSFMHFSLDMVLLLLRGESLLKLLREAQEQKGGILLLLLAVPSSLLTLGLTISRTGIVKGTTQFLILKDLLLISFKISPDSAAELSNVSTSHKFFSISSTMTVETYFWR
ncbi:ORF389 [White spot syndrome virus]|uniref:Wsv355 n=3 Tax=White spot syndrome virus TaxID=342409 RepID=Q8VAP6_WSSVS|nr:wsv355 [Shrimp white spot syndrome virus]AFX59732.1 wsv355 [White spot syndrome virus]AAL33357.1 wsv355 [Shrimp white spot syndrome virus]AAL89282.1 WSSV414 [Shrimp white spot syndrome virus]ATU83496.1 ORF389 [White spot syndrome virus]AWQ60482.1 wsv355 [Shrimp white spot syndrome virus]